MARYLVIVESPAKVKTIKKFLGSNYVVAASNGHVRDLPKSQLGVDVENDYEPKYITIRGKGEILANLRKEVKKADKVYLATDPDREGEAISWHLSKALKLEDKKVYRISFNEITKNAVKASLKNPRDIDMDLVDAQQARRVLDRVVGYRISPLLWAKVKRGLSAGRVQSVALRIIADREAEIDAFIPEEYWTLDAELNVKGERKPLIAKFYGTEKEKMTIESKEHLNKILKELDGADYEVSEIKKGERTKKAPVPFTTSTLQQEASKALNFATSKTMRIAQQLYEGVDVKGSGTVGIITYLRTDSTRISEEADANVRSYIGEQYGSQYVAAEGARKSGSQKIQDAHEAIRPTDVTRTPAMLKDSLSRDQFRLYQLIWKRFVASRMMPAVYETTSVKIAAGKYRFNVATSKIAFEGFRLIYTEAGEEKEFVFSISRELFELYDERVDERTVPQGMYGLELGFSVQDIRAAQKIEVTPVFPVPKQIQGWDKTERLLETKAGEQIFEELYRKITEKAGGIFAQRLKEEKNVREMLLSQPIRIVHLMIWNEMTDSELIAILEKVNQELYHDYREKMRSLEKK